MTNRQEYIWAAKYADGSYLMEFECADKENSFYSIKDYRSDLVNFGLLSSEKCYSFDIKDGLLNINGNLVGISYNGKDLTNNHNCDYSDIITYKDAEAMLVPSGGVSNRITKFNIGYKAKIKDINMRVIYTVDLGEGSNYLTVRLVSPVDIDGVLKVGKFEIKAPLQANMAGEIKLFEEDFI